MSRVPPYTEMKRSGVKWIGSVPKHWDLLPARTVVANQMQKNDGAKNQNYLSLVAGQGVIPYADKGDMGNKKPDDLTKCKLVRKGNLVINSMNYFIGSYGMSPYNGVCSPVYIVLDVKLQRMERRFALRVFSDQGFQKYLATFGNGILAHRAAIGWDDIKGAYVSVPPPKEQKQIAAFLDYETAKIDALIEKQQQLIALLGEKRQAVISHAVTKGLNPDAPMRDSGIEWLGEVPEHWETQPLKYLCTLLKDGTHLPPARVAEGVPLLSVRNLQNGRFGFRNDDSQISEVSYRELCRAFIPKAGDVFMAIVGATLGKVAIVPEMDRFHIQRSIAILRSNKELLLPRYLAGVLASQGFQDLLWERVGFSAQPGIYLGTIENFRIPLPPLVEQTTICREVSKKANILDLLIDKATVCVELLRERRTALISAAVTGKIDVRGWKPPSFEVEPDTEMDVA